MSQGSLRVVFSWSCKPKEFQSSGRRHLRDLTLDCHHTFHVQFEQVSVHTFFPWDLTLATHWDHPEALGMLRTQLWLGCPTPKHQ